MKFGGIILCGGRSTRMGFEKAALPFGPESMLARVARRLGEAVGPLVVVAAPEQPLDCPAGAQLVRDRVAGQGPLEGLYVGLQALTGRTDAAYVTACDAPLLAPAFVRQMCHLLGEAAMAVPREGAYFQPLAAVYRVALAPEIARLLAAGKQRLLDVLEVAPTRVVPVEELRAVDAELASLGNCNHPEDYLAALARSGCVPDARVLKALGGRGAEGT